MVDVVIFGGTTEGRELAEFCSRTWTPALVCVATELGERAAEPLRCIAYHVGRLERDAMAELLREQAPSIVVDATHPHAAVVTQNVAACCAQLGLRCLRVRRSDADEALKNEGVRAFADVTAAVAWLNSTDGTVFAATGIKAAAALTGVNGFADRVVLRVLPAPASIQRCLDLGYPSGRIVAMQGPFGRELNLAMFRHFGASILLTKDSGAEGGFDEKLVAARECSMACAVISRPGADQAGVSFSEAQRLITQAVLGA
jgi:precorrin-6x reductase